MTNVAKACRLSARFCRSENAVGHNQENFRDSMKSNVRGAWESACVSVNSIVAKLKGKRSSKKKADPVSYSPANDSTFVLT